MWVRIHQANPAISWHHSTKLVKQISQTIFHPQITAIIGEMLRHQHDFFDPFGHELARFANNCFGAFGAHIAFE